jgi:hypothetical protein
MGLPACPLNSFANEDPTIIYGSVAGDFAHARLITWNHRRAYGKQNETTEQNEFQWLSMVSHFGFAPILLEMKEIQPSLKSMKKDSPSTGFVYHPNHSNANDKNWTYAPPKKKLQSIFPSSKINPPAFSCMGRFPQPSPGQVGRRPAPPAPPAQAPPVWRVRLSPWRRPGRHLGISRLVMPLVI